MSLILDEHREFLADRLRLEAFEAALREVIRPEHVVLDLAAGTGILGLLACRAGARRVYSVDDGGILQVAREIGQANHLTDRICYIKGFSTRTNLPEKADVVVADQIGHFGFEAGVLQYFDDARARLLNPGAITVPSSIDLYVAPVEASDVRQRIGFWQSSLMGFDLTPAHEIALNSGYPTKLRRDQLLGVPAKLHRLDLSVATPARVRAEAELSVERDGTLHGIGGWFSANLSKHVTMTNSPLDDRAMNRRNVILPIARPVDVFEGDRIRLAMSIVASELIVTWRVEVTGRNGEDKGVFDHSTWRGMLLCPEDLAKMRSDGVPRLSPWGAARRSVLELCDGERSVSEIEAELRARYLELFPSPAEAALFVSEVLVPYSV